MGRTLTEPSQVSKVGPRESEQWAALHLSKTISLLTSKADLVLAPLTMVASEPMGLHFSAQFGSVGESRTREEARRDAW